MMKTIQLLLTILFSLAEIQSSAQSKSKRLNRKLEKIRIEATKLDGNLNQIDTLTFDLDTLSLQVIISDRLYVFSCHENIRDTNYNFEIRAYGIDESNMYYKVIYPSMKYSDLYMTQEVFVKNDEVLFEWWPSKVRVCTPIPINSYTGIFYDYPILFDYRQLKQLKRFTDEKIKTCYN